MAVSDSDSTDCVHRRARRALLASLETLDAARKIDAKSRKSLEPEALYEALTVIVLRFVVLSMGRARGLFTRSEDFAEGRLFAVRNAELDVRPVLAEGHVHWAFPALLAGVDTAFRAELEAGLKSDGLDFADCPAELVGNLYELLLGDSLQRDAGTGLLRLASGTKRKQTGTFFTPRALTEVVVARALEPLERRIQSSSHRAHDFVSDFRVCDPTVGGGAFLVQVARALTERSGSQATAARRRSIVTQVLYGVDINPIAVAVAEAALCLFAADPSLTLDGAGRNLRVGDALVGAPFASAPPRKSLARDGVNGPELHFPQQFPEVFARGGFDLVVGNPPWVAYAGRAAKPLTASRKAYLAAHYTTLKGYPTLHGLFVERALRIAPQGTVALVVPSPIADLDGYRAVRRAVRASHTPCEPMLEFGQDAFKSVTQPCFALIAEASTGESPTALLGDQPFRLAERQRASGQAQEILPPSVLAEIAKGPSFPRELFGEMGFQTTGAVTRELLLRAPAADDRHRYPLLEGRDVREFIEGEPHLFLDPDPEVLCKMRCRLRPAGDYARVHFVIRQTARYPIAALHRGLPFRNSLLAGFAVDGFLPDLVVGLLNSSLYRALHLATQRDARQAVFPQVKVAHLRALPAPPANPVARAQIAALSAELTRNGVDGARAARLDTAVFSLFSVSPQAAAEIFGFLAGRGVRRAD